MPKTRAGKAERAHERSASPSSESGRKSRKSKSVAAAEPVLAPAAAPPPSPSKKTKASKRVRVAPQVPEAEADPAIIPAQNPALDKSGPESSGDDLPLVEPAVSLAKKSSAKSSKKSKKSATQAPPSDMPVPASKCIKTRPSPSFKVKVTAAEYEEASAEDRKLMEVVSSSGSGSEDEEPASTKPSTRKLKKTRRQVSPSPPPSPPEASDSESSGAENRSRKFPSRGAFERLRQRAMEKGAAATQKSKDTSAPAPPSNPPQETTALDGDHNCENLVFVHQSSMAGDCLFSSASHGLGHILACDPNAFDLLRSPSATTAVHNLLVPGCMRTALCDYVEAHMDVPFENLGWLSPRETIQRDYIDADQLLRNDQGAPEDELITSIDVYVECMRRSAAHGDEIMLAMLAELLNLRCVVVDTKYAPSDGHLITSIYLDIRPAQPHQRTVSNPQRRYSSDMSLIFMKCGSHFDWAHLTTDPCDYARDHCDVAGVIPVRCLTSTPILSSASKAIKEKMLQHQPPTHKPQTGTSAYALPDPMLLSIATQRRQRQQVVDCLVDEHDAAPQDAEAIVALFERNGVHAKLKFLPDMLRIMAAMLPEQDPLADQPNPTIASASRHVAANALKRANSLREAMDAAIEQLDRDSAHPDAKEAELREGAANAVRIVTKCSHATAVDRIAHHLTNTNNHAEAVLAAVKELSGHQPNYVPPPAPKSAHHFDDSGLTFMEQHLGAGTREMTMEELIKTEAAMTASAKTGMPMTVLVPKNLNRYWQHHLEAAAATPRGSLTVQQHQRLVRSAACAALHYEACDAATAARRKAIQEEAAAQLAQRNNPVTATAQTATDPAGGRQSAPSDPIKPHFNAVPVTPTTFASSTEFTTPAQPGADHLKYKSHSSPAVRMAAIREDQAQSARTAATTVVVMAGSGSKPMQWKAGEEKDGRGFYLKTYMAVQQSWEQHNKSEEVHGYRTFRSTIHCTMVPIICAELALSRADWDKIQDAELITRLDKILQPSGPVDFLIKLRAIRFNHNDTKTSLVHRYRAFAEPFLQQLAEAQDAGCPINEESIKLAFKSAIQDNFLMLMWLQESRWISAVTAHQRIAAHLKTFDQHSTLQMMNGNHAQLQALAAAAPGLPLPIAAAAAPAIPAPAAIQAPPAAPPRPQYTPEQRQAYQQQQQQLRQDRQHNREAALVNMVAQQFNGALQHQQMPPPASPVQQQHQQYQPASPAHQQYQHAPVSPMVNLVQPVYHPAAPAYNPAPAPQANAFYPAPPAPRPAFPVQTPAAPYVHPGLDARGPNWHPLGCQNLKCRQPQCISVFCQGCGEHGHTMQDCKKRNKHALWNYSGYYAEQRPGQGPLIYDGTPYRSAAQPAQPPQQAVFQIPPPPRINVADIQPFPVPYALNAVPQSPQRAYTPVMRSNVAVQAVENVPAGGVPPVVPQN